MLFLHETHKVKGEKLFDFEDAYRTGWMAAMAKGDDARLLWYTNQAMGTGPSYHAITITAIKTGPISRKSVSMTRSGMYMSAPRFSRE